MTILGRMEPSPSSSGRRKRTRPEPSDFASARSSPLLATSATRTPDWTLALFSERTTMSRDSAPS